MSEAEENLVYYHPEIEIGLGEEFGIKPLLETEGGDDGDVDISVLEVQPFVLRGVGRGKLKLREIPPDSDYLVGGAPLVFPAGSALPLSFTLHLVDVPPHQHEYLTVYMKYYGDHEDTYKGINDPDEGKLSEDGVANMRIWEWEDEEGPCQPLYPPRVDIIEQVKFYFIRNS